MTRKLWLFAAAILALGAAPSEQTIYIARHGETVTNRDRLLYGQKNGAEIALTEKGVAQALSLAELLKDAGIEQIYVSRLRRSQDTAAPLAKKHHLHAIVRSQLDESHFGSLEGMPIETLAVKEALERSNRGEEFPVGGGESRGDVQRRIVQLMEEISARGAKTVLIVAHFGTARELLQAYLGLSPEEAGKIRPPNDVVYKVEMADGRFVRLSQSRAMQPFQAVAAADLPTSGK